jgi:hypothetical protein
LKKATKSAAGLWLLAVTAAKYTTKPTAAALRAAKCTKNVAKT